MKIFREFNIIKYKIDWEIDGIKNYESADIEIHIKDKGMVLKEKSLAAFTQHDEKILAFGVI